jgi:predicted nucleotidyltransferase
MREKTVKLGGDREITYDDNHWNLFNNIREKSLELISVLNKSNINCFLHGSPARGDVNKNSDIDIVIFNLIPSFNIEISINEKYNIVEREIIQATPNHNIKGHIHLEDNISINFPLAKYSEREFDFYRFGGIINLRELSNNIRVPGVNKKLLLIKPTQKGHIEFPIINQQSRAIKILKLNPTIIQERIRVLTKRDKIGRTGIFLKSKLAPDDTFENKLKQIADRRPEVRHKLKR